MHTAAQSVAAAIIKWRTISDLNDGSFFISDIVITEMT